jgi:hypothetical protein
MARFFAQASALLFAIVAAAWPVRAQAAPCSTYTITRVSAPIVRIDTGITPALTSAYVAYTVTNSTGATVDDLWVKLENFGGTVLGLATNENGVAHVGTIANGATAFVPFYLTATGATSTNQTHDVGIYTSNPSVVSQTCATNFQLHNRRNDSGECESGHFGYGLPQPSAVGQPVHHDLDRHNRRLRNLLCHGGEPLRLAR